jgi:SPP1 gp7 family putative phage head morphogenesis protein
VAITSETLRIVDRIRKDLTTMTDAQTFALAKAWAEAWDVLAPDFTDSLLDLMASAKDGRVPASVVARSTRLRDAMQATRAVLDELAATTEGVITNDISPAVLDAVDGHAALIGSQLPPNSASAGISFTRMSPDALAAIVERTTQQIHSSVMPLPADVERVMKRELIRGIAVGQNPRKTAARIVAQSEQRFNGGLTRALTIARTETLDAHREATMASEKANKAILEEWEWSASLSARTCPSCWAKHGTRHPLDEAGPLDHQNGRCARVTVAKSWKDLGFNIKEPENVTQDAEAAFNNLIPDTQKQIMGAQRLELLQSGQISWADLSTKHQTDGWRDSYGATPVKDLIAKAA